MYFAVEPRTPQGIVLGYSPSSLTGLGGRAHPAKLSVHPAAVEHLTRVGKMRYTTSMEAAGFARELTCYHVLNRGGKGVRSPPDTL